MIASVSPISPSRFLQALRAVWHPKPSTGKLHVLGLAISGGVDSMALAYLCSQVRRRRQNCGDGETIAFRAFVVNHKARTGSGQEAKQVASRLRRMGIPVTVLNLDWDQTSDPGTLRNFETKARTLRYRMLGRACRHFRISSLLTAHHGDDQAETVLVRILAGRTGVGLRGMKAVAGIPESFGLFGVGASGSETVPDAGAAEIKFADGGVMLHRPLLCFGKDELLATCVSSGTQWVEDPTNQDVLVTSRNCVRHLLQSGQLPRALRKPALLALSEHWQSTARTRDCFAAATMQTLKSLKLDARSGRVSFRLPTADAASVLTYTNHQQIGRNASVNNVAKVVEQLANLVSAEESVGGDQLANIVPLFQSQLLNKDSEVDVESASGCTTTAGGVLWTTVPSYEGGEFRGWQWSLSRQLSQATALRPCCTWIAMPGTAMDVVASTTCFWTWQLFDGRFWIRARHGRHKVLTARLLRREDMMLIRANLTKAGRSRLDSLLADAAPGDSRFTLPVLSHGKDGSVLALPTIDFRVDPSPLLEWQIQYKKTYYRGDFLR